MDLTLPSDVLSAQLEKAYLSKKRKYCPVRSALHHYIREDWIIEILPWVISISGLADMANLQKALSFLDILSRWSGFQMHYLSRLLAQ